MNEAAKVITSEAIEKGIVFVIALGALFALYKFGQWVLTKLLASEQEKNKLITENFTDGIEKIVQKLQTIDENSTERERERLAQEKRYNEKRTEGHAALVGELQKISIGMASLENKANGNEVRSLKNETISLKNSQEIDEIKKKLK